MLQGYLSPVIELFCPARLRADIGAEDCAPRHPPDQRVIRAQHGQPRTSILVNYQLKLYLFYDVKVTGYPDFFFVG